MIETIHLHLFRVVGDAQILHDILPYVIHDIVIGPQTLNDVDISGNDLGFLFYQTDSSTF